MIYHRISKARGHTNQGWLDSYHTFSFANYYDPNFMGFSTLRAINEDRVLPNAGSKHIHKDMEILSYVLTGSIEQQDGMGYKEHVSAGEFQIISAGTGVEHAEYNPSTEDLSHRYQMWIIPDQKQLAPRYETKDFSNGDDKQLILSPDARDGSLKVFQDMLLWRWRLKPEQEKIYVLSKDYSHTWFQIVSGEAWVADKLAFAGDGILVAEEQEVVIRASQATEILVFEMS